MKVCGIFQLKELITTPLFFQVPTLLTGNCNDLLGGYFSLKKVFKHKSHILGIQVPAQEAELKINETLP